MGKRVGRLLSWVGGLVVVFVLLLVTLAIIGKLARTRVPERAVVVLDLDEELIEDVPPSALGQVLLGKRLVLRDVVEMIERAADDPRVAGLILRVIAEPKSMAKAQELRDAILGLRKKGKFALAFADTFGEIRNGSAAYYLATACDEIWLQPSGDVGLTGMLLESPFLRGTLDKVGIKPELSQRYEYKTAANLLTERKFTPAHREASERLLKSLFGQLVRGIAKGRGLDEAAVRGLVDRGPLLAAEALQAHLVDRLGYREDADAQARARAGQGAKLIDSRVYLERAGRPHERGPRIALIYGVGGVSRGKSDDDPFGGGTEMGAETVAEALRQAASDREVKAILFRIDSPGGSYVASDSIWHEVVRARQQGKPVVVSMGTVAASGGYFVAAQADKIVAHPGTLTGSIGVVGGKVVLRDLSEKLGISWDSVHVGAHATTWSVLHDFTPEEWARVNALLDRIYEDFTSKVAAGRKLSKEQVREIAKGRVWSGEDARALGLVDELGGFPVALRLAKQAAGIAADAPVELHVYPPKKELLDLVYDRLRGRSSRDESRRQEAAAALASTLAKVHGLLEQLGVMEFGPLDPKADTLRMPPLLMQ